MPLNVEHSSLERLNEESGYKSKCPVCKEGALFVARGHGFRLLREDRCLHCLQPFVYLDIEINGEPLPPMPQA